MRAAERFSRGLRWGLALPLVVLAGCAGTPLEGIPPTVVSRTPLPGAEGVGVAEPIRVEFSEPLRASAVNNSTVLLTDSADKNIATELILTNDGRFLSVKPTAPVSVPNTLTLKLSGLADLAGNPLAEEAWSWSLPAWLSAPAPLEGQFLAGYTLSAPWALDSKGNPFVFTVEGSYGAVRIQVTHWTGSSWENLGSVGNDPKYSPFSLDLSVDAQNHPVVSWVSYTADSILKGVLFIKRWTGSAWEALPTPQQDPTQEVYSPTMLANPKGEVYLGWLERNPQNRYDFHIKQWSSVGWNILPTPPAMNSPYKVHLELGRDGQLFIFWAQTLSGLVTQFQIAEWTGAVWNPVAESTVSGGFGELDMGFTASKQTYIVSRNGEEDASCPGRAQLRAYKFETSVLSNLSLVSGAYINYRPSLVLDRFEHPLVFWKAANDWGNGSNCWGQTGSWINLMRWNGSRWISMKVPFINVAASFPIGMETDVSNYPVLAWWSGNTISFARLNH